MSEVITKRRIQCKICGKWFEPDTYATKICSDECRRQSARIRKRKSRLYVREETNVEKVCLNCGKPFRSSDKRKIYCCVACRNHFNCGPTKEDKPKKPKKKTKSIAEIAREARAHGMDYGNYVVLLEGRAQ